MGRFGFGKGEWFIILDIRKCRYILTLDIKKLMNNLCLLIVYKTCFKLRWLFLSSEDRMSKWPGSPDV